MKSFSTYLELKEKWTISQFIESLFQVYGIEYQDIDYNQKRIENHCYDIYQYPHDGSVVVHLYHRMEYIYNEKEGGLCIHNDGYQKGYRYIDELLSKQVSDSARQIQRYIRLTDLIEPLLKLVDEGQIAMRPAVELSYLEPHSQQRVLEEMEINVCSPSHDQTIRMRKAQEERKLTDEVISVFMQEE